MKYGDLKMTLRADNRIKLTALRGAGCFKRWTAGSTLIGGACGKVFADIDISLDGFVAGEDVSPENPLGVDGEELIWYGDDVNDDEADLADVYGEVDATVLREAIESEGAVIMGRSARLKQRISRISIG